MFFLQIEIAREVLLLGSKEIKLIGVFLLMIVGLTYALVYYVKKYNSSMEKRIDDEKGHSDRLMEISEENNETHSKYLSILEIIKLKLFGNAS